MCICFLLLLLFSFVWLWCLIGLGGGGKGGSGGGEQKKGESIWICFKMFWHAAVDVEDTSTVCWWLYQWLSVAYLQWCVWYKHEGFCLLAVYHGCVLQHLASSCWCLCARLYYRWAVQLSLAAYFSSIVLYCWWDVLVRSMFE